MFLLDQPEMEPTLTDARVILRQPESIDPTPAKARAAHDPWHNAKVIVGLVSATAGFQLVLCRLLTAWLDR